VTRRRCHPLRYAPDTLGTIQMVGGFLLNFQPLIVF
jgi:hypothetical protein